jgi:hypothetical protein
VLGAALVGLGVPKDSVIKYERSLQADKFLLIANGSADEVEQARQIIARTEAVETAVYAT